MAALALTPYPSLLSSSSSLSLSLSLYIYIYIYMTYTHISTITWIPIRDKNNWWQWLMLWCQAKSVKKRRCCHEASMKSFPNSFFICSYGTLLQLDITHGPHKRYILNDKIALADWLMFHDCIISEAIINY